MVARLLIVLSLVAFCASASISSPTLLRESSQVTERKDQLEPVAEDMQADQPADEAVLEAEPRQKRKAAPCAVFCQDTDKTITINNHYTKVYTQAPPSGNTNYVNIGK